MYHLLLSTIKMNDLPLELLNNIKNNLAREDLDNFRSLNKEFSAFSRNFTNQREERVKDVMNNLVLFWNNNPVIKNYYENEPDDAMTDDSDRERIEPVLAAKSIKVSNAFIQGRIKLWCEYTETSTDVRVEYYYGVGASMDGEKMEASLRWILMFLRWSMYYIVSENEGLLYEPLNIHFYDAMEFSKAVVHYRDMTQLFRDRNDDNEILEFLYDKIYFVRKAYEQLSIPMEALTMPAFDKTPIDVKEVALQYNSLKKQFTTFSVKEDSTRVLFQGSVNQYNFYLTIKKQTLEVRVLFASSKTPEPYTQEDPLTLLPYILSPTVDVGSLVYLFALYMFGKNNNGEGNVIVSLLYSNVGKNPSNEVDEIFNSSKEIVFKFNDLASIVETFSIEYINQKVQKACERLKFLLYDAVDYYTDKYIYE